VRFLIVTLGSLGDLLPFLTITKALVARGHEVSIAGSSHFEPYVEGIGVEFTSILSSEQIQRPAEDASLWKSSNVWRLGMKQVLEPAMRSTFELICERARRHSFVVLARPRIFGARIAAERHGTPLCTVYMSPEAFNACDPNSLASQWRGISGDEVFGPDINAYRRELGMHPVSNICEQWMHSPENCLGLFPEWFCPPRSCWPVQATMTGFVTHDDPLAGVPPPLATLEEFLQAGYPPVVFTPGTGMPRAANFFSESLSVCAAMGLRAIFLTHNHAQLPSLPHWALHADYIPMRGFLERTAALVHVGGAGTCAQAIRAGVPQLLVPTVGDQFDNSLNVENLGLGITVPMSKYEEKVVTTRLTELTSSASVRKACKLYASMLASDNALEKTCDYLEGMG
jgi:rhamnosyltransferase subunit B